MRGKKNRNVRRCRDAHGCRPHSVFMHRGTDPRTEKRQPGHPDYPARVYQRDAGEFHRRLHAVRKQDRYQFHVPVYKISCVTLMIALLGFIRLISSW